MTLTEILETRGIPYAKTNNPHEIMIKCPSGEHDDKHPSLSINLEKNVFNCWSCGFKGGGNKLLQALGVEPYLDLDTKQPYRIAKLRKKLDELQELDEVKLPEDRKMFQDIYRGISSRILTQFNTFTTNEMGLTDYLCIPIYQNGKLKFIEGRLTKDLSKEPKYNRRPSKAKVSDTLFPLDKILHTNYVILVEGLFDMLNMWQLGYKNTLCIFGATNFNSKKVKILDNLGITRVDIMMDSDAPGEKAAEKIAELLDTANIYSRIIKLPKGVDPGELTSIQAEMVLR